MIDKSESDAPTATNQIYEFIGSYLARSENNTNVNRASAASMCHKRRWYQYHGYPGENLTPRKIVNFTLGDLTEHTVKFFIKQGCVGVGKLYSKVDFGKKIGSFTIQNGKKIFLYDQPEHMAQIGSIEVSAHADGWGKRNSDGKWELIEVKSASDYGFDQFKESGPGEYLKQAMVNLQTNKAKRLKAEEVRFFYLKKDTGHLWDRVYPFDPDLAGDVAQEYILAIGDTEPKAPHVLKTEMFRNAPTGRTVAQFPCTYCPYLKHCHGEYSVEFKSNRPVYVFKVTKKEIA